MYLDDKMKEALWGLTKKWREEAMYFQKLIGINESSFERAMSFLDCKDDLSNLLEQLGINLPDYSNPYR